MKKWSLVLIFLGSIILNSCSSTPSLTGRWQADIWDCDLIEFTADYRYVKYEGSENKENIQSIDKGDFSYIEQEDLDCVLLNSEFFYDNSRAFLQWFTFKTVSDDQIILYINPDLENEECPDLSAKEDLVQINLTRVK